MGNELLASTLLPLWLKVAWTAMVLVIVLIYWRHQGPANFLWFSDTAFLVLVPGLWLESPFILSIVLLRSSFFQESIGELPVITLL